MAKMTDARTTIRRSETLSDRVLQHIKESGENLTECYNRAILNQLENDGDFEIRDIIEGETTDGDC